LEELPSCFYCVNDFTCVSPMLSLTKDTDWVSLFLIIPTLLSFRSCNSTVSGCIIYFVSFQPLPKVVYQGLHIPVLPIFIGSHNIGPHLRYSVKSGHQEPLKHVGFAHCQQCIVVPAHAVVKFLNLLMTGRFTISSTCAFTTSLLWPYSDFSLSQANGLLSLLARLD